VDEAMENEEAKEKRRDILPRGTWEATVGHMGMTQ